ncbi:phage tail tip lysozyme [Kribbella sp.]|uniref:phage tail tip lysozyme n=1 Tax=Kribbella sp. TaxID=1871183 RepID=UPI002D6E5DB6|nr:phage tail tip lysozyme [Kribbella sp.]HZX01617.1 phage tail tip lysozyme [Kribbella sp.]
MGDSKALPILGGIALVLILPLVIVVIMLLSALGGLDSAEAQCAQSSDQQSLFGYPTASQKIDVDWTSPAPGLPGHQGYDFAVKAGTAVLSSMDGKVVQASGNEVRIRREDVETRYLDMGSITVSVGQDVARGHQIGTSGSGNEPPPGISGDHLHWELWVDKDGNGKWQTQKPDKNPFEIDPSDSAGACSCQTGNLSGSNNEQKAFNYFVQNGYTKEQAAGIVGNMSAESGVEPSRKQYTDPGVITPPAEMAGSPLGWGIVQWTPADKMILPSRKEGADDAKIASLEYQLDFLRKQLIGEGPVPEKGPGDALKASTTAEEASHVFADQFERFGGHENPNAETYGERAKAAERILRLFGGVAPASDPKNPAADPCGAGSGNIATVAKNLAWPDSGKNHWGTDASLAKPEYVAAMAKYNDGPNGQDPYTDCGRFVATVMHMSGADPKFPNVFTPTQRDYMLNSGKYDHWESIPPGGMKPGDILNGPGHTYLYVGPWGEKGGGFDSAAGSLGQHVPAADHLYNVSPGGFWVFRLKSGATPTTTPAN